MSVVDGNGWKYGQGFSNRDLPLVVRRLMRNSSRDFGDVADFRRLSREFRADSSHCRRRLIAIKRLKV
jgi:hypothetical protein